VSTPLALAIDPVTLRLRLLGSFRLEADGVPVVLPSAAQRLVALLCLRGQMTRRRSSGLLWPETTSGQAMTNLRQVIWRLQSACPVDLVRCVGNEVGLAPTVQPDVHSLLERGLAPRDQWPASGPEPEDLTLLGAESSDLLPDWDDEWLTDDRERLRQLRLHVLESWSDRLVEQGHYVMALEAALAALRTNNLRETAHRAVIRVHIAEGNVCEARRAYAACCRALRDELGVDPSLETTTLLPCPG
jgi:DNA-binding SARP family transcriptional activator